MKLAMEIADFAAGCLIQYGNFLKIKKKPAGWLCSMAAIVYWIARAHYTGFCSQEFWHMVSFTMALSGYLIWRKQ